MSYFQQKSFYDELHSVFIITGFGGIHVEAPPVDLYPKLYDTSL